MTAGVETLHLRRLMERALKEKEQAAFEDWLMDVDPHGDVESVQRQWLESSAYRSFLENQVSTSNPFAGSTGPFELQPRVFCVESGFRCYVEEGELLDAIRKTRPPCTLTPLFELSDAARLVLAERARQIGQEAFTLESDDAYTAGELAIAAAAYAVAAIEEREHTLQIASELFCKAGFAKNMWKPTNPLRDLVKAGALIQAEIERRLRVEASKE